MLIFGVYFRIERTHRRHKIPPFFILRWGLEWNHSPDHFYAQTVLTQRTHWSRSLQWVIQKIHTNLVIQTSHHQTILLGSIKWLMLLLLPLHVCWVALLWLLLWNTFLCQFWRFNCLMDQWILCKSVHITTVTQLYEHEDFKPALFHPHFRRSFTVN